MPESSLSSAALAPPSGVNHLVFNVRDIEESHHFWTELLGFHRVGTSRFTPPDGGPSMRFYSGIRDGQLHHHDIALFQLPGLQPATERRPQSLDHVAIEYPTKAAWLARIDFLTSHGVTLHSLIERGTTHSIHLIDPNGITVELVFELPREEWEDDIQGALNRGVRKTWPA